MLDISALKVGSGLTYCLLHNLWWCDMVSVSPVEACHWLKIICGN